MQAYCAVYIRQRRSSVDFRVTRRYRKDFQLFASDLTLIDVMGGIFLRWARLMGGIHIYISTYMMGGIFGGIFLYFRILPGFLDFPGIFRCFHVFPDFRDSALDFAFDSLRAMP